MQMVMKHFLGYPKNDTKYKSKAFQNLNGCILQGIWYDFFYFRVIGVTVRRIFNSICIATKDVVEAGTNLYRRGPVTELVKLVADFISHRMTST